MDFLIVYERKQRELENAVLLKIELEERGYDCKIVQYYEASKFNIFNIKSPKVILVPHLYGDTSIYRNFSRFGKSNFLINFQYEQVLSEKWEKLGHHNPKGEAKKGIHICWGIKTKERLLSVGIDDKNLKIIPPLHIDLLRKEYRRNSKQLKMQLSKECNIDAKKSWNLFISSFTYADVDDYRLRINENVAGVSLSDFKRIHTESRDKILVWFRKILNKDKENLLIYRPHPDELNIDKVLELENEFENFKFIRHSSVKDWIETSDNIYSWYSTSIVESHFLNKSYAILRPMILPNDFDSVLVKKANFIEKYIDFDEDYFKSISLKKCAIEDRFVREYYEKNDSSPSYKIYADFLEDLYKCNKKQIYNISLKEKIKAYITTINVSIVYLLYKLLKVNLDKYRKNDLKRNFLIEWFIEMDNQIVADKEKNLLEKKLKEMLKVNNEKE
ncbi:hypothetical protein CPG38_10145 [Malaciobacter marinus]|uniref:hypothetical protein n=1 Tax=Malaciobacter marinus TaxID=505249 RepID=UPI000C07F805|nr:hypothetical protein [Malaciobacter marinus]PHO11959.1 hypothetical protein CPG38_10145 [Malaciobacter marinus]